MKAKQKNIRVFELFIESDDEFFSYMQKNLVLLRDYMLLLRGSVSSEIIDYLNRENICYKELDNCNIKLQAKEVNSNIPKKIELVQYVESSEDKKSDTTVFYKPIRSGVVIEEDGDIAIFSRVNSGAKVSSSGNIIVTGEIDGVVECDGDFMILKNIAKGYAIFNGDILEKDDFQDSSLKVVKKDGDGYIIEELV